ncbi:hypothetical protein GCM10012275_58890 [Longimycelium tulufanense]|uniref:Uncharacterized protein n=1 Tax=Longimycelium tulufanense TaxID=907463 RepID=A0A8J3CL11_9PSEU|nr:hypothetical protein GCM10012275_58890 [Longimycelium tulufanense]
MPEHQHVRVGEPGGTPLFPALGGPGLVHHGEPDAGQLHGDDLGQPRAQVGAVVVAVHTHQAAAPCLELVEQGHVHPVAGVDDHVGPLHRRPQFVGQVTGPLRHMGVGHEEQPQLRARRIRHFRSSLCLVSPLRHPGEDRASVCCRPRGGQHRQPVSVLHTVVPRTDPPGPQWTCRLVALLRVRINDLQQLSTRDKFGTRVACVRLCCRVT